MTANGLTRTFDAPSDEGPVVEPTPVERIVAAGLVDVDEAPGAADASSLAEVVADALAAAWITAEGDVLVGSVVATVGYAAAVDVMAAGTGDAARIGAAAGFACWLSANAEDAARFVSGSASDLSGLGDDIDRLLLAGDVEEAFSTAMSSAGDLGDALDWFCEKGPRVGRRSRPRARLVREGFVLRRAALRRAV